MAQRYGLLPSEVMIRSTTFDLQILDIALSYEKMRMDQKEGKVPQMNQDDMLAAIKQIRGSENVN